MPFQFAAFADESDDRFSGQIAALKRNNFSYLEIRNLDGKNVTELTLPEAEEIKNRLYDQNLAIWSIGSPIGKISIEEPFEKHLDLFKHTLEIAAVMAADHLRLFSFFIPNGKDPADYKNAVLERLNLFAETAAEYNIILCHENEKGIYGDIAPRCTEIHKEIPELKCVFDPANYVQCGQNTLEAWEMLYPYIEYMHVKDALPDGRVVPPGMGQGHVKEILAQYRRINGKVLTLEPHLYDFVGLKALERAGEESAVGAMEFETAEQAFDYAANMLRQLTDQQYAIK